MRDIHSFDIVLLPLWKYSFIL